MAGWVAMLVFLALCLVPASVGASQGKFVLNSLLGTAIDLEDFWFEKFRREPVVVRASKHRPGESRVQWVRDYREFFQNENVDRFLSVNLSAYDKDSPLIYGKDLWMERSKKELDGWIPERLGSFRPNVHSNRSIPLHQAQEAFRDGFSLVVNRAQYRSSRLYEYTRLLQEMFGVPVDAQFRFRPASPQVYPDFHAHDTWMVQLDGRQTLQLYQLLHHDPLNHMEYAPSDQQMGTVTETLTLSEGDMVYIPRGFVYDLSSKDHVSMHIAINVHLQELTFLSAILMTHEQAMRDTYGTNSILQEYVDDETTFTWGDFIKTCIRMLADVTDEMRKPYPVTGELLDFLKEVDDETVDVLKTLSGILVNFIRAGTDASSRSDTASQLGTVFRVDGVFEPVLDVLANDPTADYYASRPMQVWAVKALNAGEAKLMPMLETFRESLRELQRLFDAEKVHRELVDTHAKALSDDVAEQQTIHQFIDSYKQKWTKASRTLNDVADEDTDRVSGDNPVLHDSVQETTMGAREVGEL